MSKVMMRAIPTAAVALMALAPASFAQGQELFQWTGQVDRQVQLVMRGGSVRTDLMSNTEPGRGRARVTSAVPRTDGQVQVQVLEGRGNVYVVQQPTAQNGYTTVVRIDDPDAGQGTYRIRAYWQNYSNGEYIGGRARGQRDRDCDRDDRNCGQYNNGQVGRYTPNGQYLPNGQYVPGSSRTVLHWSGSVDGDLEIRLGQNGGVSYRTLDGRQPMSIRADRMGGMMPAGASVSIVRNQGRGSVDVVQQPSQYNGYTTVIRVHDPQGGYGYYDFNVVW